MADAALSLVEHPDVSFVSRISAVPKILDVVSQTTGMRQALVARVTEDEWIACATHDRMAFGIVPGSRLPVESTLCREVMESRAPIVIDQASSDVRYSHHPVPKAYGFESYISVPIFKPSGDYFGNLCALDTRPMPLSSGSTLTTFQLFAELIGRQIEDEERHAESRAALQDARQAADFEKHLLGIVSHDLRNPIAAIQLSAAMLGRRESLDDRMARLILRIQSSADRATRMIRDLLDFTQARVGGGIQVSVQPMDLHAVVRAVIDEVDAAHPNREIRVSFEGNGSGAWDSDRIAQVVQNLLTNAVKYSPEGTPITVFVREDGEWISFLVHNHGDPIPSEKLPSIFEPFKRATTDVIDRTSRSVGLGLYIVKQIVNAHRGSIHVQSTMVEGTTFSLRLPRGVKAL